MGGRTMDTTITYTYSHTYTTSLPWRFTHSSKMHSFPLLIFLLTLPFQQIFTTASTTHDPADSVITKSNGRTMAMAAASVVDIVEHPLLLDMPGLLENATAEAEILEGLIDLQYNNYSDLYFLFTGKVLESRGVSFTHALVSRFPSVDALQTYYDYAISDIATKMMPWRERGGYSVDYQVPLDEDLARLPSTDALAFHVTLIKASSNTSDTMIMDVMDAFLALRNNLHYVTQLTTGANLYLRESYKTMSHAFSVYLPSIDALETLQQESSFLSVLNDQILPIAESYALVTFTPFTSKAMMLVI